MRKLLFILTMCFTGFAFAQNTTAVKIISLDSLKKYNIGIAKKDSSKIYVVKTNEVPWSKMNMLQKGEYIVKTVVNDYRIKYPVTFWILASLLAFWLLKQISRLFKK
ncbi:hypothetical protein [Ferruginibacter sp.]|nr:hypothetical protein [Ferruginibacter sp.]